VTNASPELLEKRSRAVVAILCAVALITGLFSTPANARTTETLTPASAKSMLTAQHVDSAKWHALPDEAKTALVREHSESLISTSGLEFDFDNAQALRSDDGKTLIRLPALTGQGVVAPSSLNLFLDGSGQRLVVIETAFVENSATSGSARIWTDGKVTFDKSIDLSPVMDNKNSEAAVTDAPVTTADDGYVKGDWWGNLNKCLNNQGIAAWAAALLAAACGAACVVTAGAGCIACLVVLTGGTSGVIGSCIAQANMFS